MDPKEYRKILEGIELKNIWLEHLETSVDHSLLTDGIQIEIKDDADYECKDDFLVVKNSFRLKARGKNRKSFLKIHASYTLIFETESEITDEFFEIYKEISLPLNVWPFFRELVNSLTSRMGIPPLTLPLLKR